MNKLYYINLIAFIACVVVMANESINTGRFAILLLLSIANLVVFITSLIKNLKKNTILIASSESKAGTSTSSSITPSQGYVYQIFQRDNQGDLQTLSYYTQQPLAASNLSNEAKAQILALAQGIAPSQRLILV